MEPNLIEKLYKALRDDPRLQKDWERNQPRIDRALEAILIVRTPREVATACLLACKLRFEPAAAACRPPAFDNGLISWARTQKQGGARLANIVEEKTPADQEARTAVDNSTSLSWMFPLQRSRPLAAVGGQARANNSGLARIRFFDKAV
ncbi:MAG: hypothetical protein ABIG11_08275 [bacterium]